MVENNKEVIQLITNNLSSHMLGAPSLQTSVANAEILSGNPSVTNFTFAPDQPCTVKINGDDTAIYVKASQKILGKHGALLKIRKSPIPGQPLILQF